MSIEYRRQWFVEITEHLRDVRRLFLALMDKDSTSKQRRAIEKAHKQLDLFEKSVVIPLKKKLGV
jgi:hypothetical protein